MGTISHFKEEVPNEETNITKEPILIVEQLVRRDQVQQTLHLGLLYSA